MEVTLNNLSWHCTFCNATVAEAKVMVTTHWPVCICIDCLNRCLEVLKEKLKAQGEPP